jgi:hypothetical protein
MIADQLLVGLVFRGGGCCVFFEGGHLTGGPLLEKNKQLGRVLISRIWLGAAARSDEIKSSGHTRLRLGISLVCRCNIKDHVEQ